MMSNYKLARAAFEKSATKKGYSFDQDKLGFYEDMYLQEAWEIFIAVDLKMLIKQDA